MGGELLQRLHAAIDTVPRGRADLLARSGLKEADWRPTVVALLECGAVIQQGDRRGARYVRGRGRVPIGSGSRSTPEPRPPSVRSEAPAYLLEVLLAAVDDVPRARAELTERSGIDPAEWGAAIWTLHQSGAVFKVGDRGSARYFRAPTGVGGQTVVGHPMVVSSPVRQSAHDDVEDIFRELGAFDGAGVAEVAAANPSPPQQLPLGLSRVGASISAANIQERPISSSQEGVRAEPKLLVSSGFATIIPSAAPPAPKNCAPGGVVVVGSLQKPDPAQPYEAIDKRSSGGCLWIVDSPKARESVAKANVLGAGFVLAPGGGRATNGRAAWWTKRPGIVALPMAIEYRGATALLHSIVLGTSPDPSDFQQLRLLADIEIRTPQVGWRFAQPLPIWQTGPETVVDLGVIARGFAGAFSTLVQPTRCTLTTSRRAPPTEIADAAAAYFEMAPGRPPRMAWGREAEFQEGDLTESVAVSLGFRAIEPAGVMPIT
jgi:hypothetical protein